MSAKKTPVKGAEKRKAKGAGDTAEGQTAGSARTRVREPNKARSVSATVNAGISSKGPKLPKWTGEPKFTAELRQKIVAVVARGNFRDTACATAGISSRTLRTWLSYAANPGLIPPGHHAAHDDYLQFERELEQAEAEAEVAIVDGMTEAAKKDWRASAWLLEHRASKRWGYKAQVEFTIDEALEAVLDDCATLFGPEAAVKLFGAIASRRDGGAETRRADRPDRGGGSAQSSGGERNPVH